MLDLPGVRPSCLQSKSVFALHVLGKLTPKCAAVLAAVWVYVCLSYDKKITICILTEGHRGPVWREKTTKEEAFDEGEKKEEDVRQEGDRSLAGLLECVTCWGGCRKTVNRKGKRKKNWGTCREATAGCNLNQANCCVLFQGSEGKDPGLQWATLKSRERLFWIIIFVRAEHTKK